VAGEWKLSKWDATVTETDPGGTDTYVFTSDGTNLVTTFNNTPVPSYAYTMTLLLEKSGAFTQTIVSSATGSAKTSTDKGEWFFAGKNKALELKNKEAIVFDILSSTSSNGTTTTYTGVSTDDVFVIDQLKSKEMIIISETSESGSGASSTTKSTMVFTQ